MYKEESVVVTSTIVTITFSYTKDLTYCHVGGSLRACRRGGTILRGRLSTTSCRGVVKYPRP